MSDLAVAQAPAPTAGAISPAALAARIEVPRALPARCDGQPLRHLSYSSYALFLACPDAWRRKYLCLQRQPKTAAMVLGSRVDDALSDYHRHLLEAGERLPVEEVIGRYRATWAERLEADRQRDAIVFDEFDEPTAIERGVEALKLAFEQLLPRLGMPVAVQRRVELTLAPGLEWSIEGYVDLETQWPDHERQELVSEVVDYKVKGGDAISQAKADCDLQASLYLAARWLEGRPAECLAFAQILRAGKKRKTASTALVKTQRTAGQLRATLARIALAAGQISALYERFGPETPWGFADPASGWRCSQRYCPYWHACPGGAGL